MKTLMRRFAPTLFATLALLSMSSGAFAHAALESSDPAEGESIATPYVLVARYDEELAPDGSSIVVRAPDGTIVAQGSVADDDFTMIVELPALAPGPYVAHWIAITADDNGKTQGDINFTVTEATPSPAPTATPVAATSQPPSSGEPTGNPTASGSPAPTSGSSPPTPPASGGGEPTGGELVVPLVLAGAVVLALGWFLLRRRPT